MTYFFRLNLSKADNSLYGTDFRPDIGFNADHS